jgi:hypothetical protein
VAIKIMVIENGLLATQILAMEKFVAIEKSGD